MISVKYTSHMEKWLHSLKDLHAAARIKVRIRRMQLGHFGDVKYIEGGIFEMRIHCGAGYRVYFIKHNNEVVILLCGGGKNTQQNDIALARKLVSEELAYEP